MVICMASFSLPHVYTYLCTLCLYLIFMYVEGVYIVGLLYTYTCVYLSMCVRLFVCCLQGAMATVVSIDRRKTCSELEALTEEVRTLHTSYVLNITMHASVLCQKVMPGQVRGHVISIARKLPAGMHIYDTISGTVLYLYTQLT